MIYCSHCGTQNRDGSKFCSNCAARLAPPSGLICPMCSTPNPVETVFCNNCGARLVPLTGGPDANRRDQSPPIKGLSLPAKPSSPAVEPAEEEDEPVTKEKIDHWLSKLRASPPMEEEETAAPIAPVENFLTPPPVPSEPPTWVKQEPTPDLGIENLVPPSEPSEPLPLPPETREELPDWLKELGAETRLPESVAKLEPEAPAPVFAPVSGQEQLPDWLQSGTKDQPPAATPPAPTPLEAERDEEPAVRAEEVEFEAARAIPIQELEPELIEPAKPEEIPSWVAQLKPSDQPPPPAEPTLPEIEDASEISEWLRTPALELAPPTIVPEPVGAEVELEGPLANLRGVLPLAIAMAEPHTIGSLAPVERKNGAQLFDEILAAPLEQPVRAVRRRSRRGVPSMRAVIYMFLALAVTLPLLLSQNVAAFFKTPRTPDAEMYDAIQALGADATVLVAFDYDPSVAGEMDLIANAVVRHLVRRRVKIIGLSTLGAGPTIAQQILDAAAAGTNDYRYGTQYLNLGFLPGGEVGLAQLATQGLPLNGRDWKNQVIGQYPLAANVKTMGSLAMVIELAGSEEPLKSWVEQFRPRTNARVAVGASAAVEPKARTYRGAKQLIALVSGASGAAQYEILANQPGEAVTRVAAQSAAQIVLIAAVILGNIAFWLARLKERKA